jgi:3-hydroxyisobutyrate dehydrogenase-like beta-hydroxyacid dehydrogenase
MSDVTVIGLGPMGVALTHHLLASGRKVTVWNRTAARAAGVVERGAALALSAAAALRASPIGLVCVADYAAARAVLGDAAAALAGKVLVQLSTGTPADARTEAAWALAHGAEYLVAGPEAVYRRVEPALRATAGGLAYLGPAVGAAATWDLATLSCLFAAMFGLVHGARIVEAEGMAVGDFGAMITQIAPTLGEILGDVGRDIATETYANPYASMKTCAGTGTLLVRQAAEAGIDTTFPAFADGLFQSALGAGFADERFASLIKVLRRRTA